MIKEIHRMIMGKAVNSRTVNNRMEVKIKYNHYSLKVSFFYQKSNASVRI